jgi:uncharacterized repeat protein (TIGR01451 family)
VQHGGDSSLEFYPAWQALGDCGTLISVGGQLYAPNFRAHGTTATTFWIGTYTPFTSVSQTSLTGSGTAGDPYRITTVVDAGTTGLRLTETDSYVVGGESYQTDVTLTNTTASAAYGILYRAGDCFLGDSDYGYGAVDATSKSVACAKTPNNSPSGRLLQWQPLTTSRASDYQEDFYGNLWTTIGNQANLTNNCACGNGIDNAGGLDWNIALNAGASMTASQVTTFSPAGLQPLSLAKSADNPSVLSGSQDGYTITVNNPNPTPITLTSIVDTLPLGFTFMSGSATGDITTQDPAISANQLTWSGSFSVSPGSHSLHFNVHVSTTNGNYCNSVAGSASGVSVAGTGCTASIAVGPTPTPTNTVPPQPPTSTWTPTPTDTPCPGVCPPTNTPTFTPTPKGGSNGVLDSDGDGMPDWYEFLHPCLNASVADGNLDADGDGLTNLQEYQIGTDPCNPDTDGDGMPDGYEHAHPCLDQLQNDANIDADNDGLTNLQESHLGTDPCNPYTAGDGYTDGQHVALGKDPLLYCPIMRADVDGDGVVSILDLSKVAQAFGQHIPPAPARYDQDGDGVITILDLSRMAQKFGQSVSNCP